MVERIQQLLVQCDEQLLGSGGSGPDLHFPAEPWEGEHMGGPLLPWAWGRRIQSTSVGLLGAVLGWGWKSLTPDSRRLSSLASWQPPRSGCY